MSLRQRNISPLLHSQQSFLPIGRQNLQHRHDRRLECQRHNERQHERRHHLAEERDGHRIEAQMERCITVERLQSNDDRMNEIRTVGDTRERIYARRRQQRIDVATVARRAGNHDPGQRQRPRRVAERTEGGRTEARQFRVVQAVDQIEQRATGRHPAGDVRARSHAQFAIGFEQNPADAHANQIRSEAGPRLVVDLVEQRQRIVAVGHVIVGERKIAGGGPRRDDEHDQNGERAFEVAARGECS